MLFRGVRGQWDLVNLIVFKDLFFLVLLLVLGYLSILNLKKVNLSRLETPEPSPAQGEGETSKSSPEAASSGSWAHP